MNVFLLIMEAMFRCLEMFEKLRTIATEVVIFVPPAPPISIRTSPAASTIIVGLSEDSGCLPGSM